jgi:exodeoxyribonuclease-3
MLLLRPGVVDRAAMRIATWNVNSLKARFEKLVWWVERAAPDVLLLQETKSTDADAPHDALARLGYELSHHGSGGRNGVAIASRTPVSHVETNFGEPLQKPGTSDTDDDDPFAEARKIAGVVAGVRVVSLYAPNGRTVDSPFYAAKLAWFDRLARWLEATRRPDEPLVLGGDFNVAPTDADVWDPKVCHGGTHVSPPERAAFARLVQWGLIDAYRRFHPELDRYTWWDYRAGDFHRNVGMRIDHLLVTPPVAARAVGSEIDREARKGKPIPSDHAPLLVDLDEPGRAFDPGWAGAEERIAARRAKARK